MESYIQFVPEATAVNLYNNPILWVSELETDGNNRVKIRELINQLSCGREIDLLELTYYNYWQMGILDSV